jgi:hypothetical protein
MPLPSLLLLVALAAPPADCPEGNLLAGRRPWAWQDLRGRIDRPTDGEVAPEGAAWDAPLAVVLDSGAATLTWDLGAVTPLAAAWIQADANDEYSLWGSVDGRAFRPLGRIEPVAGHGLRGRRVALGGAPVRYLRFGEGQGDGLFSLSEIAVYCRLPSPFPPAMRVGDARPAAVARSTWNDATSARWQLALAVLGLALLGWGAALGRVGRPDAHRRLRDRLLAVLGVIGALTYVNFGFFHFGRFIHEHEWTHYYLGAKYAPELSYDRLYHCLCTADAEDGLRRRVELRKVTNLRTNVLETTEEILAHPEGCKSHFSEPRWQAFRRDVAFFRARQSPRGWDAVMLDHGYNAPPVWTALGKLLAGGGTATASQIQTLALLDPLYLAATLAVVWWAFGWRTLSVALVVFATFFPCRFYWTGGSFLRWDWLFYTVAAVCCLARERPLLAGAALAYATGLRIFPLFVFAGPALAMGWHLLRERRLEPTLARFFAAAALAGLLLFSASVALSGGLGSYTSFVQNTRKHEGTAMTNNMGLPTVLAWRPHEVGRFLNDDRLVDPWRRWKLARTAAFRAARPLYLLLVLGHLALLALAVRRAPPWVAAALGVTLIATGVELLSYYYAFVLALALLCHQREEVGRWLLGLSVLCGVIAWAPLPWMSTWFDEQFTAMSAATLAVFAAILWRFRAPAPS